MNRAARFCLAIALLVQACGTLHYDFSYEPNELAGLPQTDLKIAVLPFVDRRETYDRGSRLWTWLPLVPYATEESDVRQDPSAARGSDYYLPGLVAYSIALDLLRNRVGARVDLAPQALEDYDLVIHGTLDSNRWAETTYAYLLGPASFVTLWVGAPQYTRHVDFKATYVVYDSRAREIARVPVSSDWSVPMWNKTPAVPFMHGVVKVFRQGNHDFVEQMPATIRTLEPISTTVAERIRLYHERLDPELADLLAERDRIRAKQGALYREYEGILDGEIRQRARLLESYRRVEERVIGLQQAHVYETQRQRLIQIAELRQSRRDAEARQRELQRRHTAAVTRPLAAAVVAGVQPTMADAEAAGGWQPYHTEQLAQDLSAALAVLPSPPPPPDLTPLIRDLDIDMTGFESAGAVLAGVRGNSVPEMRASFLERYRERVRPLGALQAEFMARHRG